MSTKQTQGLKSCTKSLLAPQHAKLSKFDYNAAFIHDVCEQGNELEQGLQTAAKHCLVSER